MASHKCNNCHVASLWDNWLITTSFLLGQSIEELSRSSREVPFYFCPVCAHLTIIGDDNKINDESEQNGESEPVIIDFSEITN